MVLKLPKKTASEVDKYFNLKIGPYTVPAPYFQNITGKRGGAVHIGKGSPEDLEREANKLFSKRSSDFNSIDAAAVRYILVMAGLGIDCSGFVARILLTLLAEQGLGNLRKNIKQTNRSFIWKLRHNLRNTTNLSANTLTSDLNCVKIEINDTQPGDLIRYGRSHVAIISEVEKSGNQVNKITYCHSTWDYLDQYGVRRGQIKIINDGPLEKQQWNEVYQNQNWSLEDYLKANKNDRGLRRLRVLNRAL